MDSGNDNRDEVKNWHEIDSPSGTPGLEGLRKSGIRRRRLQHDSDVYFEAGEGDGHLVPLQRVSNFVIDAAKKSEGKTTRKGRNPWNRGVSPELDNELENNPTTTKGNAENSEPKADKKHRRKKRPPRSAEFKYSSVLWDVIERYTDTEPSTNIIFQIKDFILNFLFFIATTVLLYGSSNQLGNYYSNIATKVMIESKCEIPKSAPVNFLNIRRDAELWSFVDQVLLKVLYENTTLGRVLSENVLLGRPRIRQIRVKGDTCSTANLFEPFFKSCYDYYNYAVEDKEPFGLKSSHWKYQEGKDREQTQGRISTYDSGGYMYELDNNLNDTKKTLDELERNAWVRLGTGAVFVDFSLYSPNADKFSAVKLIFEFLPTGGIRTKWKVEVFRYFVHVDSGDYVSAICIHSFSVLFILYYTLELVQKLRFMKHEFFTSWWNIVDFLVVILGYVMTFYWAASLIERNSIANRLTNLLKLKNHESFDYIFRMNDNYLMTQSFIVFLSALRMFKITIFRPITMVTLTISCVKKELLVIKLLHVSFVMGFALLGNILFGVGVLQFRNLWRSFYTLYCLFIGGLNFIVDCQRKGPNWTKIFFGTYIFAYLAIFFNLYIAIVIIGYRRALLKIEYLDELTYFEELCSEAIYACLNLCSTKRLSGKLARRRLEKIRRKDREALAPILRRYECRGLHLALILKKYERGSTELEKSYDDDKIYSEIQLRNQLIMEVEEHEKISQQLEKVAKSLDFMDQNLSDITSKVDYLVNKVINKKRVV
ncbi:unnamed protein product [Nesidiocoris tenuis]|uniref:Uncharacterized protein n=1 Tax=Nesidiocoris tenuis TaxID=355587 RepID=A0A6H5G7F4_9HEMI|nr:unnamed protein product [Nesidiocoris tenuis]